MELSGGISGYVLRNRAIDVIEVKMEETMKKYGPNQEISLIWDKLQNNVINFRNQLPIISNRKN